MPLDDDLDWHWFTWAGGLILLLLVAFSIWKNARNLDVEPVFVDVRPITPADAAAWLAWIDRIEHGRHLVDETFAEKYAAVVGFARGHGAPVFRLFHEWVAARSGYPANISTAAIVVDVATGQRGTWELTEQQDEAARAQLFAWLREFLKLLEQDQLQGP